MQAESHRQHLKRISHYLLRVLADLTVKFRVIVRSHATLEQFGIIGAIKEARRDAQRTDPVTSSPYGTDFIGLAIHLSSGADCRQRPL
jgi:hypothetical protein